MAAGALVRHGGGMKCAPDLHNHHRFPAETISDTSWLYYCTFYIRNVELMRLERAASRLHFEHD
jgi:hypothetical protein